MYQCFMRGCDTFSVYSLDYTAEEVATTGMRSVLRDVSVCSSRATERTEESATHRSLSRASSLCYMGNASASPAVRQSSSPNAAARSSDAASATSDVCGDASCRSSSSAHPAPTTFGTSAAAASSTSSTAIASFTRPRLFRRKTAAHTGDKTVCTPQTEKRSDRLLRRRTDRHRHEYAANGQHTKNGALTNTPAAVAKMSERDHQRYMTWRRHSADDTLADTLTTIDLAPRTPTRPRFPAGKSRLETMLPELFQCVADILFADPASLVRVSHLSCRMRDKVPECTWRRACHFWDAQQRPEGWFSSWREFYVLYVCPTRFPKLEVLQDKKCFSCSLPCPISGQFLNNDRGLVPYGWGKRNFLKLHTPENNSNRFDYKRNGNLLFCPKCRDMQTLPEEQGTCCVMCNHRTVCAHVRLRVFSVLDTAMRREEEHARNQALVSFGSAAAAASWRAGDNQHSNTSYTSVATTQTTVSAVPAGAYTSSAMELSFRHADRLRCRPSTASLPTGVPRTVTSEQQGEPALLIADTTASSVTLADTSLVSTLTTSDELGSQPPKQQKPIFWGHVWNDTTPCAYGIRFSNGLPPFVNDQAVLCGDCVRSLGRLGYGQLEMAVRYRGVWALTS
ncbi:hypothetical protein THASP1DRAFT_31493 [Thamnocephalis sphaerospora]|uniref:F-box domain-containing protein n=1 Tax=Thamnocephalis sphaerospora TaxID=78915 RepID=A0A4P9XLF1_9FUNG|nr:hypothetical protein THASP1DRAFT_31493 [Thamnocephalis sphaerospora]|eukprot:RKP06694.1 hypothetical protein THASP1DRAFT_31493 [Thamnocephalis sphaerospora]